MRRIFLICGILGFGVYVYASGIKSGGGVTRIVPTAPVTVSPSYGSGSVTLSISSGVATDTTTIQNNVDDRSVPVRFSDEGTNLANVTAVDCVGAGVSCAAVGTTVTVTIANVFVA